MTELLRIRDAYARREANSTLYSSANAAHVFQSQERERNLLRLLATHDMMPLADKRVLEVGCGTGGRLRDFIKWGVSPENLFGVELLPGRAATARQLLPLLVTIECQNAAKLPYEDSSFDIVLQAVTFTSILDFGLKAAIAREMLRVLKPTGIILWTDFFRNNPRNPDVRGVPRSEIAKLFPKCRLLLERTGLLPPVARRLIRYSWLATYLLARVPWLCTHYTGVIYPRQRFIER